MNIRSWAILRDVKTRVGVIQEHLLPGCVRFRACLCCNDAGELRISGVGRGSQEAKCQLGAVAASARK